MDRLELYKIGIEQFREHPRIYWTRSTFFVTLQTGLMAFAAFDLKNPSKIEFTALVLAFVGLVISVVWYRIAKASRELLHKWRQIVLDLESDLFEKEYGLFQRSTAKGEGTSAGVSITSAMVFLAGFFVFAWCCLCVYVCLHLFW